MKKQILVVEDNELNRAILGEILAEEYQVLEAENGQVALDILHERGDSISLILLDMMMPVMDGFTFLDRVKSDQELALIPVIVMTQSDSEADEVAALAHGAADFVPKPYRPQVILHRAASLINLRENAAMVNQFMYDRLTGLFSKEYFYERVRRQLKENPDKEYTIICSNIENFKLYNDTFGMAAGDLLLQQIAEIAQAMVGKTGFCGRLSADRFLSLQQRDQEIADRSRFGSPNPMLSPQMKKIVMRWGIYEVIDRTIPVEQMCDRALLAADSIKGQYNQYFAVYDDKLRSRLLREKAITDVMETALSEGQFVVYYQPKYSLRDGCMAGAEALVRWIHPEWGFMSPGEFIPLFEKNGFIPRVDQYVWEQVCAQLREWKDKGYPLLPVSVNVSRSDVYQAHLEEKLLSVARKHGVDPKYLHLEITESAYAENPNQVVGMVDKLRSQGFVIEMDDFGSGYSSLNMFSQMSLDVLKLDMSFVRSQIEKCGDRSILGDIIAMAHRLRLSVVAEGVETREQMERLRAVDCDYIQGYYYARPMPAQEFEQMLKAQASRPESAARSVRHADGSVRALLAVDESEEYLDKVSQVFLGQHRVLHATDAQQALAILQDHEENGVCAVILSMTLPGNGAQLILREKRQNTALNGIPVLATIPNGESAELLPMAMETDDFLCKCHPMIDMRRRIRHLLEMEACRERESVLQNEANRDPLTGLLNRRGLHAALESVRSEEQPLTVCMFDLDDLKKINDTHGHEIGDRMILAFADLLRQYTRTADIQCRYGGDEFAVILKRLNDEQTVVRKCEAICAAFRECLAGQQLTASSSVGIVLCQAGERLSAEQIARADQALYRAKREQKGSVCVWHAAVE
ncbi:MAG: EAL domain-containing protein [Candidatus Ventricola sp.]